MSFFDRNAYPVFKLLFSYCYWRNPKIHQNNYDLFMNRGFDKKYNS